MLRDEGRAMLFWQGTVEASCLVSKTHAHSLVAQLVFPIILGFTYIADSAVQLACQLIVW